ncbi:sigma-70 family RNA polymerase sigma factor [Amycolatopsis sp. CA-230715]|uniref:sigma-70 family RNA polymerase sigma factor n=1 Tax=Amycolatopsis sp. CA-230715 TaxID=2745196 RepID=UPI001C013E60|nr:sigma-70 family RNA polymerase sigma factor [Amycolatopsis sp. CA-230715]QWF78804.1 putative ECF RNA polymerase sigma factor SigI [Amycolatopsis sp. CA-230715]
MEEHEELAARFEEHRAQLRAVAYRMLGSLGEADDAVQEAWLRLSRTDVREVESMAAWLRTVVSRVCLDMLRSRKSRREDLGAPVESFESFEDGPGPEEEVVMADSVGRALLVVLDALGPDERVAFVLHDLFAVPFDRIAPIVDRSPVTTKKLASRARARVRGTSSIPAADLAQHRLVIDAFLAASRGGDLTALLEVLAPDVVRRADPAALPPGRSTIARGSRVVAEETVGFGRRSRFAETALVNGSVGVVVAPAGRLALALTVTVEGNRITAYEVIASPERLRDLDIAVLPD